MTLFDNVFLQEGQTGSGSSPFVATALDRSSVTPEVDVGVDAAEVEAFELL